MGLASSLASSSSSSSIEAAPLLETVVHLVLPGVILWVGLYVGDSLRSGLRLLAATRDIVTELRELNTSFLQLQDYIADRDALAVPEGRVISLTS